MSHSPSFSFCPLFDSFWVLISEQSNRIDSRGGVELNSKFGGNCSLSDFAALMSFTTSRDLKLGLVGSPLSVSSHLTGIGFRPVTLKASEVGRFS